MSKHKLNLKVFLLYHGIDTESFIKHNSPACIREHNERIDHIMKLEPKYWLRKSYYLYKNSTPLTNKQQNNVVTTWRWLVKHRFSDDSIVLGFKKYKQREDSNADSDIATYCHRTLRR